MTLAALRSLAAQLQPWVPAASSLSLPAELPLPTGTPACFARWIGSRAAGASGRSPSCSDGCCSPISDAASTCKQPQTRSYWWCGHSTEGGTSQCSGPSSAAESVAAAVRGQRLPALPADHCLDHFGLSSSSSSSGSSSSSSGSSSSSSGSSSGSSSSRSGKWGVNAVGARHAVSSQHRSVAWPMFAPMPFGAGAPASMPLLSRSGHTDSWVSSRYISTEAGPQLLDSDGRPMSRHQKPSSAELQPEGSRDRTEGQQSGVDSGQNTTEGAEPANGQGMLAIDRSGLRSLPEHEHGEQPHKGPETPLLRHLKALIRVRLACAKSLRGLVHVRTMLQSVHDCKDDQLLTLPSSRNGGDVSIPQAECSALPCSSAAGQSQWRSICRCERGIDTRDPDFVCTPHRP